VGLDIASLLQDKTPETPGGEDLEAGAELFSLEEKLKGVKEDLLENRPAQPPNWPDVRDHALALLARSHDLSVAVTLLRALIVTDGLAGLRDGLALLNGLIERHWYSMYPKLDPADNNDPTQRINLIAALVDLEAVVNPVTRAPLVNSKQGRYTLRDLRIATGKQQVSDAKEPVPSLAAVDAAFTDAPLDDLSTLAGAVAEGLSALDGIERKITDRTGLGNAIDLTKLRDILKEIRYVLGEQLSRRGVTGVEGDTDEAGTDETVTASVGAVGRISNRQDVMRTLDTVCDYYARSEPSSPVPLLLQRAKRLVCMDFLTIIADMAPESVERVRSITGSVTEN
jgi:type VI secretion system protein ImpA